jgi:hypothetical protein
MVILFPPKPAMLSRRLLPHLIAITHQPIHFRLASFQVHTRLFLSVASMASTPDQNRGSWKTPSRLLKCNTKLCQGSSGTSEENWTSFSFVANISAPFLADITCGECQDSFSVCLECPRATSQLRTKEQIKRHCRIMLIGNGWQQVNLCKAVCPNRNLNQMEPLSLPQKVVDPCHHPPTILKRLVPRTILH